MDYGEYLFVSESFVISLTDERQTPAYNDGWFQTGLKTRFRGEG